MTHVEAMRRDTGFWEWSGMTAIRRDIRRDMERNFPRISGILPALDIASPIVNREL